MNSEARNNILKKIRAALTTSTRLPFPNSEGTESVVQPLQQDIVVEFAEQFTQLQGKFAYCADQQEMFDHFEVLRQKQEWDKIFIQDHNWPGMVDEKYWSDDIVSCDISITNCEALVARTGSIILSTQNSGRITSVYAPVHVCIAYTSQLVYDLKDALEHLTKKYKGTLPSMITFATGPSRTADIEKTLVVGVHGPKEVYLFLIDDGNL